MKPAHLGLVSLLSLAAFAQQTPPSASRWVAFDASFVRTQPGMRKVVGFFHRGGDGSTREESNVDGPAKPVVIITNITTRLEYVFENGTWTSYPLNIPPQGVRPDTVKNPRQYTPARPVAGMDVMRFVNPQGEVQFQAPKLNYFAVLTEQPAGAREIFSNFNIREQPADLFLPPPSAKVTARADGWRGPIWYPTGETAK